MTIFLRIDHNKSTLFCQRFHGFLMIFSTVCTLHNPTPTILYATNKSSISSWFLFSLVRFSLVRFSLFSHFFFDPALSFSHVSRSSLVNPPRPIDV